MNPFRLSTRLVPAPRGAARTARRGAPMAVGPATAAGARSGPDPTAAVVVPWRVVRRSELGAIEVEHCGDTALYSVRFALAGRGVLGLSLPRTVLPGERMRAALRGIEADGALTAPDAMLVLRWFQPDGTELLWPISL